MKLEISFQKLKEAVNLTEHVAGKHQTLPVLSCILIEVKKRTAIFKSTNLDIGVEVSVPVKSEDEWTMAVPARTLSAFISQIYDQNQVVRMEESSGNLIISTSKSKGTIKTLPADDFPSIPHISDGQEFKIATNLIIKGLKSVCYSSSVSNVKPELSSIYVYHENDAMVFVATDSFRLAEKKVKSSLAAKLDEILIPFKNTAEIIRLLEMVGGDVDVRVDKNLIAFRSADAYFASRVINGTFPDYRQIIPRNYSTEAVLLKQDLLNALKISNIFSDKFNQVRLLIDPKAKTFEIQTKNSDVGENKTSVDGALSGERVEASFNYRYIADCLQSIEADSVSIQMSGLGKPMVIRPVSGDQSFLYLVMPMNK